MLYAVYDKYDKGNPSSATATHFNGVWSSERLRHVKY